MLLIWFALFRLELKHGKALVIVQVWHPMTMHAYEASTPTSILSKRNLARNQKKAGMWCLISMVLSWTATINGSNQMGISHQKLPACKPRGLKREQPIDIARHASRSWPMATSEDHWHTSRQYSQWWPLLLFVCAWLCSSKAHLKFVVCSSRSIGNGWSMGQAKVIMCAFSRR